MTEETNDEFFKKKPGDTAEQEILNNYEKAVLERLKRIMSTDPGSPILKKEVEILKQKAGSAK